MGRLTDSDISREMERLQSSDLRLLEAQVAAKRRAWLDANVAPSRLRSLWSPREAFELLFFDYMGLTPEELPVIHASASQIAWLSMNACPTLEACSRLAHDTRTVCRSVYEKPTQAFLSRLDPCLRFVRDYETIRPHARHCKESIVRLEFESFMRQAVEEAEISKAESNKGYGALVVLGERVLAKTHDTAATEGDPSLHAEFKAIRQACAVLGSPNLCGALLFCTCEPCPMCAGLAVWANLTSIVYGASIAETAQMGKARIRVSAVQIAEQSPSMLEVIGGVLHEECCSLYSS